ncbi:MAG: LptE family protein [Bacteroidetes bacterium]|nr:LptE family protein [Bacteroidota bacterium]
MYLSPIWIGAASISGCAYSFTGASVPAHWKSITIPLFDDESNYGQPSLREDVTNMLIQKFQRDNTLRLSDRQSATVELKGTIISVTADQPTAVSDGAQATRMQVALRTRATLIDHTTNKEVWSKDFSATGDYPAGSGQDGRAQGLAIALENLTDDLLLETVSAW